MKKNVLFVALLVLLLVLSATLFAKTQLRVTTWAGGEEAALDEAIIAEFMAQNPEYEVIYEPVSSNYYQKILTDIGAGTPPDVVLLDAEMVPRYVEGDFLTDLNPFLNRLARENVAGADLDGFFPVLVDIFRSGRSLYAIPKDTSPVGVFYNKVMFDELGVPYPPEEGWTWEEFEETARLLSVDKDGDGNNDTWGFSFPSWVGVMVPLLWAGGGEIFDADFSHVEGYLNSETNLETFNYFWDLLQKGYAPDPQEASALGGASPLFYTSRIGMIITGRWFNISVKNQIAQGANIRLGAATLPLKDIDNKETVTYASGWAVPSNVADKQGAIKLAAWLGSEYAQRKRCLEGGLAISAQQSIAELQASSDAVDKVFISMLDFARVPPGSQTKFYRPKFEETWAEAFDRIYVAGNTVKEAFDWAAQTMEEFIELGEY
ncbi:MAG TPA: sugar ABC transporter substrate-binding protein [Thermotogota bacterium]|nr:sugar ABC transporter substrate-binding protein [Thermotogota bacterium]